MSLEPTSTEIEANEKRLRIESLGCSITREMIPQFSRMIREHIDSGVVDITGWTSAGIRSLLQVCFEDNLRITLKHNRRYFMMTSSSTRQGIDILAEAIVDGSL